MYFEERLRSCCSLNGDIFVSEMLGGPAVMENLECMMSVSGSLHLNALNDAEIVVPRLEVVGGDLIVDYSWAAEVVEFPSLKWVGAQLQVGQAPITHLTGFSSLEYTKEGMAFSLEKLESLDGVETALGALQDGTLILQSYDDLYDTSALQSLPERMVGLTLSGEGQIDLDEPIPTRSLGYLSLYGTSVSSLSFLSELEELTGGLTFSGTTGLQDLHGLDGLAMVLDHLYVAGNTFHSLEGLEGLTEVEGDATIQWSSTLRSLEGLDNLRRVGGTLEIDGNENLSDASLPSLEEVGGHFYWWGPDRLVDFTGLESFRTAGESVVIQTNALSLTGWDGYEVARSFSVQFSDNLEDLTGLGGLTKARLGIVLWDCDRLASTTGLAALEEVGVLWIDANPRLADLDLPSLVSARELIIENNPELPTCEIDRLVDQLAAVGSYPALTIGENGTDDPAACP